ncbi:hypothetical protein GCM10007862_19770 [Dyella lipolytica]|uniref:Phosphate starvation-inducible protein PsiF n=1 Tax=Dyella lipolytica TaxID=1867835 RepID=A0ABW8IU48_9GAMM|nr:phosphate starvation-inducible protein PsiF [Dyella lipolytica]GLQ46926.1 hypothetical protein GCM10007862_19770 [Dyella lipolytica]
MSMRFSLLAASAVLALATTAAYAAPQATSSTSTGHSTKLGECSHAAKGKTGAAYTAARDACMKGESAPAAAAKPKTIGECNHENAGKKGQAYKDAVSACMKGSH